MLSSVYIYIYLYFYSVHFPPPLAPCRKWQSDNMLHVSQISLSCTPMITKEAALFSRRGLLPVVPEVVHCFTPMVWNEGGETAPQKDAMTGVNIHKIHMEEGEEGMI